MSNVILVDENFTSFHRYLIQSQMRYYCVQYTRRHLTAFCQINTPAWINAPRLLTLHGYISETIKLISIKFSAPNLKVFMKSPGEFNRVQTRLRVRFLPPRPSRLFGEIRYECNLTLLVLFQPDLPNLNMLFILNMVSADHLKNK